MSLDIFINNELIPALYQKLDSVLPELQLRQKGSYWQSSNKLKIDGSEGDSIGKIFIYQNTPYNIKDYRMGNKNLIKYYSQKHGLAGIELIKALADLAGLSLPKGDFDEAAYKRSQDRLSILEEANEFFIGCLSMPEAQKTKDYLRSSRGYSLETVRKMELGFIPSLPELRAHLQKKGFGKDQIKDAVKTTEKTEQMIGVSHVLTIPYRSGGQIRGFKFRAIDNSEPKYMNTYQLDKSSAFFNLSWVKDRGELIVVEGELDALSATAAGLDNVVSLAGSSINEAQVKDAQRRGAKSFTLVFDYDPGKAERTASNIMQAFNIIKAAGINYVYVLTLPELDGGGSVDIDRFIKERGIEALKALLKERLTYGAWRGGQIVEEFIQKADENKNVDLYERDLLRQKTVEERSQLSAQDRRDFNVVITGLADHGFDEELLSGLEESYKQAQEEAERNRQTSDLLRRAGALQDKAEAFKLLETGIAGIKTETGRSLIPAKMSWQEKENNIKTIMPTYQTGYETLDQFIGFTPGTMTLVAGRPSHGKTTLLFNLLLKMSDLYPDKTFLFFTYEEPENNLLIKVLNCLSNTSFTEHFKDSGITRPTNYEFIKAYLRADRTDIEDIERARTEIGALYDSQRIMFFDRSYSAEQLESVISYLNKTEEIGAVFIDYVQRMSTERRTQDKRTEIAHISWVLTQTAINNGLPIIAGAQFNRQAGGEPVLENLKEAGNLEEDSNTVLSVYCKAKEEEDSDKSKKAERTVDLKIKALKNRDGEPNRSATLKFDRWTANIREPDKTDQYR